MKAAKKSNRGYTLIKPHIVPLGDAALIVKYTQQIDPTINSQVMTLHDQLETSHIAGIISLVPSYASLTIFFDPEEWSFNNLREFLLSIQNENQSKIMPRTRKIKIPVIYGGTHGPDLENISSRLSLPVEEIIKRHSNQEYQVYFIGFQPGFPYMGGLDETIAIPRLATPRTHVAAGSVGIAGNQTGIYPQNSPGGWNIIGWTPLKLFDPDNNPPSLLAAGDIVCFCPIDRQEDYHA